MLNWLKENRFSGDGVRTVARTGLPSSPFLEIGRTRLPARTIPTEKSLSRPLCGVATDSSLCGRRGADLHFAGRTSFEKIENSRPKTGWIFRFGTDSGRALGQAGSLENEPALPFIRLEAALRLRPRRALSSVQAKVK
jgi:hypothetical protein